MTDLAYEIDGVRVPPPAFYAVACDPRRSVAVEACAGAGKTWMLVSRILRALLDGAQPHEVLAITFTRKAAGEMRQRLQEWLQAFSTAEPAVLAAELQLRGVPAAEAQGLADPLRTLHARLLAGGRPVQIRTFHGWFAALLRNAPLATLEALGLPPRHTLLEDDTEAVDKVWRRFHAVVVTDPQARRDYEESVAAHGRFQTLKALRAALSKRVEFMLADGAGVVAGSVQPFAALFPDFAAFARPDASLATPGARDRWLARARLLGAQENKTPRKAADAVVDAFALDDPGQRLAMLRKAFFVAGDDRLTQHLAKYEAAQEAEAELQRLCRAQAQHEAWLHHQRLTRLSRLLVHEFAALKRDEGWVDMSDVEQAAHRLLSDPVLSGWIQERLDTHVRHLLVDEFQDTNPLQWQALYAWLSGYAGAGGTPPSVFIVGDPKQSIYRFRRAEPQVFAAAQRFVAQGLGGVRLSCDHTRRNAPEVLAAVNHVMAEAQAAGQYQDFRVHSTGSRDRGNLLHLPVVARPVPVRAADAQPQGWRDSLSEPRELPEEHLVTLECRQAARWIAGRIQAGVPPAEILVLARKRDRLAVLEDELRLLRVPAQQPEKTDLGEAPEVQDLVALLDVLVSPTHDLSLARVLKSPVFGLGDPALVQLAELARRRRAEGTPRSWLELLCAGDGLDAPLVAVGQTLAGWRQLVRKLPPHDALDAICQQGDVLARYAASVPPALRDAALANLRALPGAALQLEGGRYATPYAFVRALRAQGVRGPAVGVAAAVRLLTVHGAKGLEAPIVLLLDTDAGPPRPETMGVLVDWPGEQAAPRRFSFLASETRPPGCHTAALAEELAARAREELNALYVAMTRAQRELVLSSVEPRGVAAAPSWWQRLVPLCQPAELPEDGVAMGAQEALAPVVIPVVPAGPVRRAADTAPARTERSAASRFGELVHRLLELQGASGMPDGAALVRLGRAFGVAPQEQEAALAMAHRIAGGEGAWLWSPAHVDWHADEVELTDGGEVLRLDRLVRRRDGTWWVVDYKSASRPERDGALQAQLRRYAAAVARLNPGEGVRAAFLTGEGRLVPID